MKVLYLEAPHKMYVKELPEPVLEEGYAIVEIELCGVCGTEIGGLKGTSPVVKYPVIGVGHEATGTIVAIGENDRNLKAGDRVCLEPYVSCGECYTCKQGRYNDCERLTVSGVHRPGMMATHVSHAIPLIHKIPDNMTWEQGAMVEPLTIALHANRRGRTEAGEYCLINGAGPIGMLTAMVAQVKGALPVVADPVQERLDFCSSLGIANICNNAKEDLNAYLMKTCGGSLPLVAIDCSGAISAVEHLADCVRFGGRIVFLGWPKSACSIDISWYIRKELDLFGSRNSCNDFAESIDLIHSGKIPATKLISVIASIDDAPELFQKIIARPEDYLKAVIRIKG